METIATTRSKEFIQVIEVVRSAEVFAVERDRWIHPFKYRDEEDKQDAMAFYGMDIFEIALSPDRWLYFQVRGHAYERGGGLGIDMSSYTIVFSKSNDKKYISERIQKELNKYVGHESI